MINYIKKRNGKIDRFDAERIKKAIAKAVGDIFANGAPGIDYSALEKLQQSKTINLYLKNLINFAKSQNFPLADAFTPSLKNGDGNQIFIDRDDGIHSSSLGTQFFQDILFESLVKYKSIE